MQLKNNKMENYIPTVTISLDEYEALSKIRDLNTTEVCFLGRRNLIIKNMSEETKKIIEHNEILTQKIKTYINIKNDLSDQIYSLSQEVEKLRELKKPSFFQRLFNAK